MLLPALLALSAFSAAPPLAQEPDSVEMGYYKWPDGLWHAWLETPGGPLPFQIEIGWTGLGLELKHRTWMINGSERIRVRDLSGSTSADGSTMTLSVQHYDSTIVAQADPGETTLSGIWSKQRSAGVAEMRFGASKESRPRFLPRTDARPVDVSGRWRVKFSESDDPAIGIFECDPETGVASGTFLTTLGDYRYLAGTVDGEGLRLSCFDGAHAFLFHARLTDAGNLEGDFWSGGSWHETWTATRDSEATLPDPFTQVKWTGAAGPKHAALDLAKLSFTSVETGELVSLAAPELAGKVRILSIFGSWCPNCNDEAQLWKELHSKYADRGLQIVGLGFELTGDAERDRSQLETFRKHHAATWPLLLAGVADKQKAALAFPVLSAVKSYPTAIFLDHTGAVRAIHSGFAGPATGEAHEKLREDYIRLIEQMLDEADAVPSSETSTD